LPPSSWPPRGFGQGLAGQSKLFRGACIGSSILGRLSLPARSFALRPGGSIAPATQFAGLACLLATL